METITPAAPAERRSGALTAVLGLAALAIGLWFAIEAAGDWYPIFKLLHVTLAVFWVGGGLTITILALRAERSTNPADIAQLADQAGFVGEKFFAPAGLLVFLAGIAMVLNADYDWGQFWIVAGLVGYVATFVTGVAFLSPTSKKIAALTAEKGVEHPETQAMIRKILLVARIDVAVLLLVVADMIARPFS